MYPQNIPVDRQHRAAKAASKAAALKFNYDLQWRSWIAPKKLRCCG
jgi:hypothetical protein